MFQRLKRSRQLRRAKPGDGSALKPLAWWQLLTRTQFFLDPAESEGRSARYTVDVHFLASPLERGKIADGERHAPVALYRDGLQQQIATAPVAFAVPGGVIEVGTSDYGLTRMHYVREDGSPAGALRPHRRSAEGLRARLARRHPAASRLTGLVAVLILLVGLVLTVPQAVELVTSLEVVAAQVGTFTSPIQLPAWLNTALLVAGIIAAFERALTLRNHWLIDADTTWTSFV